MARDLAGKAFKAPDNKLPDNLKDLDYDRYRAIRFLPERALWRGEKLPFEAQFFHRGFFYSNRVDIFEVKNGQAAKIRLSTRPVFVRRPDAAGPGVDLGFAGFRLHAPINKPDYYDEVCVFLGASYFRAVAKGQLYGLSARGPRDQHRRSQGRGISVLQDILDREAGSQTPIPLLCTPCSTARARRRPIGSPSGPATPPCSMSRWRSIHGWIWTTPASCR